MSSSLFKIIEHPYLEHLLAAFRDKQTPPHELRRITSLMTLLMGYEICRELQYDTYEVETPFEKVPSKKLSDRMVVVSVMRAGNAMLEGIWPIFPKAAVGHAGIFRDKHNNNSAVEYYYNLPTNMKDKDILIVDPLFATGNTITAAVNRLKQHPVRSIRFLCFLAAMEGIQKLKSAHPDVLIYTLSLERELNNKGYLIPGAGDAGDRLYGSNL
ncbi:MAG: uracil phosphoribosyltransferase [Oligoflexia bacterium]|nr:uracil phosphoribosyltransferase [Oligoflexia bacterium]MBF0364181.1 uracil phosphoribosyltransferase [Oligoflexia bacterium]